MLATLSQCMMGWALCDPEWDKRLRKQMGGFLLEFSLLCVLSLGRHHRTGLNTAYKHKLAVLRNLFSGLIKDKDGALSQPQTSRQLQENDIGLNSFCFPNIQLKGYLNATQPP